MQTGRAAAGRGRARIRLGGAAERANKVPFPPGTSSLTGLSTSWLHNEAVTLSGAAELASAVSCFRGRGGWRCSCCVSDRFSLLRHTHARAYIYDARSIDWSRK